MFDHVVVGAGFAGAVLARELAASGRRVLLVEKRTHIGGNCYDYHDEHGILVHRYGPHLFHTSNGEVFHYLGRFTQWQEYQHRVLAVVDGQQIPLPFNLNALHLLFPASRAILLEKRLIDTFGFDVKVPILDLKKTGDGDLKKLADFIYNKIFVNYTSKQWGCRPEAISSEVMSRVPVCISRDDRYFQDRYQVVPRHGYTRLFENLLDHPRIHLLLNTDYRDIITIDFDKGKIRLFDTSFQGKLIYTGMIDALFDYRFGRLPYRALHFDFEHLGLEFFQDAAVINYPNDYDFTRITEFKRISGQQSGWTTILREYPGPYDPADEKRKTPCYPVFTDDNQRTYEKYAEYARQWEQIVLIGRLAEYRYYDMDDIVARALAVFHEKFLNT